MQRLLLVLAVVLVGCDARFVFEPPSELETLIGTENGAEDSGHVTEPQTPAGPDVTIDHDAGISEADAGGVDAGTVDAGMPETPLSTGACDVNATCGASSLLCDDINLVCIECLADAHCTNPGFPRCDATSRRCVRCTTTSHCPTNFRCDIGSKNCIMACNDNDPCRARGLKGCDNGICVACKDPDDCSAGSVCDRAAGRCAECVNDTHCTAAAPRCDRARGGVCVGCVTSTQCPANRPFCDPATRRCVGG